MALVTIRGQLGSGAPAIGALVADDLHVDYVDRDIINRVAGTLRRHERDVVEKEMPPTSILGRIREALEHSYSPGPTADGKYIPYVPPGELPLDDADYLAGLTSVIQELAEGSSIVICGRGSQFILGDRPGAVHVLVIAPLELRVRRVMQELGLDEDAARKRISGYDSSRREFIKRHFHAELEDPQNYDLVVNSGRLDYATAASVVVQAARAITDSSSGNLGDRSTTG